MRRYRLTLAALALLPGIAPTGSIEAADAFARPNWDRALAVQVAEATRDDVRLDRWRQQARDGEFTAIAEELRAYAAASMPSAPAREAAVLQFTIKLAELPDGAIPEALLDQLESWPVQTLVPHEESRTAAVPLFNIPAAARGARTALQRRQGERRATALLEDGPTAWLAAYRDAGSVQRQGFLHALDIAPERHRRAIAAAAIERLESDPATAAVAVRTVLSLNDPEAVLRLLVQGPEAELPALLRACARQLNATQRAALLLGAMAEALPGRAALAIALLAPDLPAETAVTETLFDLLGDPELGAGAALVLARHPAGAVRDRLRDVIAKDGPAARRAAIALSRQSGGSPRNRP